MATRKEIEKFVKTKLSELYDPKENFNETDSLDKVEIEIACENEYYINFDEDSIPSDCTTDDFVTLIIKKLDDKNERKGF